MKTDPEEFESVFLPPVICNVMGPVGIQVKHEIPDPTEESTIADFQSTLADKTEKTEQNTIETSSFDHELKEQDDDYLITLKEEP